MCEEKTALCEISCLIGQRINYIGRASNMLDIHFGENVVVTTRLGTKTVGTYTLHVQCPWRIINLSKKGIHLGSLDFYSPSDKVKADQNFSYKSFTWDVRGQNLFDEKAQKWFSGLEGVTVTDAKMNRFGDAKIDLSNGDRIEIFVTATDEGECWRLFLSEKSSINLIVDGNRGL